MSRTLTRARRRAARTGTLLTKIRISRVSLASFAKVIRDLVDADVNPWPLVEGLNATLPKKEQITEEERIVVQEAVAPHLVRMTPPSVREGNYIEETGKDHRLRSRRNVVRRLMIHHPGDAKKQREKYTERTGQSHADFDLRKIEIASGDFDESDAT